MRAIPHKRATTSSTLPPTTGIHKKDTKTEFPHKYILALRGMVLLNRNAKTTIILDELKEDMFEKEQPPLDWHGDARIRKKINKIKRLHCGFSRKRIEKSQLRHVQSK